MPIDCPIELPRITDEEMRSVDYAVMSHVFATHNELGRLADEVVYQEKLARLLIAAGIEATTEVPIELSFRDFSARLEMDLVVEQKVIYELKATAALLPTHESQLLSYMYLTNATVSWGKRVGGPNSRIDRRLGNRLECSTLPTSAVAVLGQRDGTGTIITHDIGRSSDR